MSYSRRDFFASLLVPAAVTLAACQNQSPAQERAEQFVQAYYVRIDLARSLELSQGLARERLQQQLQGAQEAKGEDAMKPEVEFGLKSPPQETEDEANFVYEIRLKSGAVPARKVFVKMRKQDGQWWVTQFQEESGSAS